MQSGVMGHFRAISQVPLFLLRTCFTAVYCMHLRCFAAGVQSSVMGQFRAISQVLTTHITTAPHITTAAVWCHGTLLRAFSQVPLSLLR